jgi:hypothetical protein
MMTTLTFTTGGGFVAYATWDNEAGRFGGPDGQMIEDAVALAEQQKRICWNPWPTNHDVSEARYDAAQLGVLLGALWSVPEELVDDVDAYIEANRASWNADDLTTGEH